jgi:hypothetical protein
LIDGRKKKGIESKKRRLETNYLRRNDVSSRRVVSGGKVSGMEESTECLFFSFSH